MSRETHLGEKQLQRLCRRQLGRTPWQQLIWLSMRRGADLLAEREAKIETIAARVGYRNPFVFSTTFKRVMGAVFSRDRWARPSGAPTGQLPADLYLFQLRGRGGWCFA